MESEAGNTETAVLALAIISAIPIVIFALWGDYYERHIHQLSIKRPQMDYVLEVEKIRFAGFLVILFQLTLFLGSAELRAETPILSLFIFGVALLSQIFLQAGMERKLIPMEKKPDNLLELVARAAIAWLIGIAAHILILVVFVKITSLVIELLPIPKDLTPVLLVSGGVFGLIVGLGLSYAFSPLHIRKLLPSTPLRDAGLKSNLTDNLASHLESCFTQAGIQPPQFWIVELKQFRIINILSVGFQTKFGPFRPALFICRPVLSILNPYELEALVFNEISHLVLRHLGKRFFLLFTFLVGTAALAMMTEFIGQRFLPLQWVTEILGPSIAFASFILSLKYLGRQQKHQELEADLYSIDHLGVSADHLISALRKLDHSLLHPDLTGIKQIQNKTQVTSDHLGNPLGDHPGELSSDLTGFPETEIRIHLIQQHMRSLTQMDSKTDSSGFSSNSGTSASSPTDSSKNNQAA